jgi:hypothetical protein
VAKKSRQRNSHYLGPCDKDGNLLAAARPRVDAVHSAFPVGSLSVFYATATRIDLTDKIASVLDVNRGAASLVLSLALNQLVSRRPIERLPEWLLRSPVVEWEGLEPELVTPEAFGAALWALCKVTPARIVEDRGLVLQKELTKVWRGDTREPAQFYYDVTKQVYNGSACDYAEAGYSPTGTGKRVIGFGMVASRHNHHPVLCRAIYGSRNDTVTVEDTVNHLRAWEFKRLTLIVDRGMISQGNVETALDAGFDMVGIVPETNKQTWEYVTRWPADEIEQPRFVVERSSGEAAYARSWIAPLLGRKRMRVAVVVSPRRKTEEQTGRDLMLRDVGRVPEKHRLKELRADLGPLAVPAAGRRGFVIDEEKAERDRKADGRYLMFSTDLGLDAEELFAAYFQRDIVEKVFRVVKGEISLGPIRYRRRDRIDAYTTVVYIAYLLWSLTEQRLREKYPEMSLSKALALVESVAAVRFGAGKRTHEWTTKLSASQEQVLKHLGATEFLPVA